MTITLYNTSVAVRDYRGQYRWIPGVITSKTGPISYKVSIAPGVVWRRHTDQIRSADFALQPDSQGTRLVTPEQNKRSDHTGYNN